MNANLSGLEPEGDAHLRALGTLRAMELKQALVHFPALSAGMEPPAVLEVGAGTGQQASVLDAAGYEVLAIDLTTSHYRSKRVYDVVEYDGKTIPAGDKTMDVVFSSNVLEHVEEIDAFLAETRRVMKDDGLAIHILPTGTCRAWSIAAHYLWLFRRLVAALQWGVAGKAAAPSLRRPLRPRSAREWLGTFFPLRHGERGNTVTEMYYFSSFWWSRKFRRHGFRVRKVEPNRIFYTMANSMTDSIDLSTRRKLSFFLGSSCKIYVLDIRGTGRSSQ